MHCTSRKNGVPLKRVGLLAAVVAPAICGSARAAAVNPTGLSVTLVDGGSSWSPSLSGTAVSPDDTTVPAGTQYQYNGALGASNPVASLSWKVNVSTDPFVQAFYSLQNTTSATQTYTLMTSLPAVGIGQAFIGGSFGGSLNSNNTTSATLTSAGPNTALYEGLVDGADVLPLYGYDTASHQDSSFTASGGIGTNANIPSINVGLSPSGATIGTYSVNSTIGIGNQFTLTPGASVAFTSFFRVDPVPEPTTALFAPAAASATLLVRRRRAGTRSR